MGIPRTLARMTAVAVGAMTQTCNILSNSGAGLNSAGGRNAANSNWNPIAGGPFKCLIWRDKIFTVTEEESGVVQQVSRYKCALPLGTPVTTKNRVALVGGPVYEIQGVDDANANAVQIILDCKLVH